MEPFLTDRYGNASAAHSLGRDAIRAVDEAREQLAGLLGCRPDEVVFTSGGTESDVHAITGGVPTRTGRVLCSAVEHPAVLHTVQALGGDTVAVGRDGRIALDALSAALAGSGAAMDEVELVSVMTANNELGTINDLDAVAEVVRARAPRAVLHTDAVQAAGWLDLATVAHAAPLVSISAHKFGGPKGIGALVIRHGTELRPLFHGGGQEWERRSGTTNVAGVVGMAAALAEVAAQRDATNARVSALRDRLASELTALPGVHATVLGIAPDVLPATLHLLIDGVDSEPLLFLLDRHGVAASASSACASGAARPSHVLGAVLGVDAVSGSEHRGALRLSLGHDATEDQIDTASSAIITTVEHLRVAGRRVEVAS
mgnify:CR=1 FL=1